MDVWVKRFKDQEAILFSQKLQVSKLNIVDNSWYSTIGRKRFLNLNQLDLKEEIRKRTNLSEPTKRLFCEPIKSCLKKLKKS